MHDEKIIVLPGELELNFSSILETIDELGAGCVGLQFPEGLMRQAVGIAELIQHHRGNVEVLLSGNPCFGACDIDMALLDLVDVLFHFAHAPHQSCEKVVYVELRSGIQVRGVVEQAMKELSGKRIGVITTLQHVHRVSEVCEMLSTAGFEGVAGGGDRYIQYPGQVLGCNFSAAGLECDEYLFVGSGEFHPLGVAVATRKPVVAADPYTRCVRRIDSEALLKKRFGFMAKVLDAEHFGILVSSKPGQQRLGLARRLREKLEHQGKRGFLIMTELVTPEQLLSFKVDAFVNTACPRIAMDDARRFHVPVLTPVELEIVLGERGWSDFSMDEICEAGER